MQNLELLDLNTTDIKEILEEIDRLRNLKVLRIAVMSKDLPLSLLNLMNLEYLYFHFNPPHYSEDVINMLKELEERGVDLGEVSFK